MELHQVRYFIAVCETLSFARAAELCRVSSSSLTRAVQRLEQELGGLLIRRERRRTHLTKLGELVRPMLEELLKDAEATKNTAREFLRAARKPVRLGIMSSLGPMRIAPFLTRFAARHPEIEMMLVEGDAKRLEELLLRGTIEAALMGPISVAGERVRMARLYREQVVVVFPHGHRFEVQPAVRMTDLRDESFILRTQCEKRELVLDSCRQRGFEPRIVYRGEREDWVQMMVAAGCGITLMPENLHFRHGTVARPLIDPALDRQVSLATVAGRMQDDHVQRLVRAIQAHDWNTTSAAADRSLLSGRAQRPMIAWEAPDD